ncbi:MAG: ACT domain-containing protein [Zhaonellaceae bacterium]|jgi:chorismate mutase|nr:ACT domain-containing protein [Clostridia bacterium]
MNQSSKRYYLVRADILPEAIRKTAEAKEILAKKEASTINEAVEKVGLSRSAFYKYKNGVLPINSAVTKIITLSLLLEHRLGVLSQVIQTISRVNGNILTINQSIPLQGVANVTISIETVNMKIDLEKLIEELNQLTGVKKIEIIGNN